MAQQVVIAGALFNDVPSISVPDSNSVWHPFVDPSVTTAAASDVASGKLFIAADGTLTTGTASGGGGGDSWSWMGKNPTKLSTVLNEKVFLKDTGLATWTWGTSATTLVTAQSLTPTMQLNLNDYDYLQVVKFYVHYQYGSWTLASAITDFSYYAARVVSSYWQNYSSAQSEIPNYYDSNGSSYDYRLYYVNSSRATSIYKGGYGIYHDSIEAPTLSSTSSTRMTPTATWKVAPLKACGSNSYFSQTAFNNLDKNNSYYQQVVEIWRVDALTNFTSGSRLETIHNLNNGL